MKLMNLAEHWNKVVLLLISGLILCLFLYLFVQLAFHSVQCIKEPHCGYSWTH